MDNIVIDLNDHVDVQFIIIRNMCHYIKQHQWLKRVFKKIIFQ